MRKQQLGKQKHQKKKAPQAHSNKSEKGKNHISAHHDLSLCAAINLSKKTLAKKRDEGLGTSRDCQFD